MESISAHPRACAVNRGSSFDIVALTKLRTVNKDHGWLMNRSHREQRPNQLLCLTVLSSIQQRKNTKRSDVNLYLMKRRSVSTVTPYPFAAHR